MISLTSCFFFFSFSRLLDHNCVFIDYDIIAAELCYEIYAQFYFFVCFLLQIIIGKESTFVIRLTLLFQLMEV